MIEELGKKDLVDSELRYRRLFEAAQDGILILNAQTGMIEDVNPYLIKMLGYSREEFVEKRLWEVGAFKDVEASQEAFTALQNEKYIRYEDLPLRAKNGRLIQVEFVSNVYQAGSEQIIQCNIRDITERRLAEEALKTSEVKFRRLFEAAQDGILILDAATGMIELERKRTTLEAQVLALRAEFAVQEIASMKIIGQEQAEDAQLAQERTDMGLSRKADTTPYKQKGTSK